jgi:hypothetical protein
VELMVGPDHPRKAVGDPAMSGGHWATSPAADGGMLPA